jgi:hypothetical protein
VVPDGRPYAGFHGHEVEAQREARHRSAVRQGAVRAQPEGGRVHAGTLAMVERLLGQAEITPRAPADLDDDQRGGRARVDRHEIELVTTDMDVPGQDGPAVIDQSDRDQVLGGVTRLLSRGPCRVVCRTSHDGIVAGTPHPGVTRPCTVA